jgi:hypothetical protein
MVASGCNILIPTKEEVADAHADRISRAGVVTQIRNNLRIVSPAYNELNHEANKPTQ